MAVVVHPNMPAVARQEGQSLGMEKRLTAEGTAIRRSGLNGESERSAGVEKQRSFLTLGLGKHWSPTQPRSRRSKRPTDRGLPWGASSDIGTTGNVPRRREEPQRASLCYRVGAGLIRDQEHLGHAFAAINALVVLNWRVAVQPSDDTALVTARLITAVAATCSATVGYQRAHPVPGTMSRG